MARYEAPAWAAVPRGRWSLDVVKGGVVVESMALRAAAVVFGRQPPPERDDEAAAADAQPPPQQLKQQQQQQQQHVLLEHESASRLHAALQFRRERRAATAAEAAAAAAEEEEEEEEEALFLLDVGSTHGTILNKARLAPREFTRVPPGSQIRFGESSRVYVVVGGPPPPRARPSKRPSPAATATRGEGEPCSDEGGRFRRPPPADAGVQETAGLRRDSARLAARVAPTRTPK